MARKIIQLTDVADHDSYHAIRALCDDGTVWAYQAKYRQGKMVIGSDGRAMCEWVEIPTGEINEDKADV
jgi:hypothetical protein